MLPRLQLVEKHVAIPMSSLLLGPVWLRRTVSQRGCGHARRRYRQLHVHSWFAGDDASRAVSLRLAASPRSWTCDGGFFGDISRCSETSGRSPR